MLTFFWHNTYPWQCGGTRLYQVEPVVWTSITSRRVVMRFVHTTDKTWYKVLYQHTMYVISLSNISIKTNFKQIARVELKCVHYSVETTFCVWRHVIFPFIHQRLLCFVSHSNGMTSCQSSSTENVSCNVAQFFITTVSVIDHFHISDFDSKIILFTWVFPLYYILSSNKGIFVWPIWPEVNCPYFHTPGK